MPASGASRSYNPHDRAVSEKKMCRQQAAAGRRGMMGRGIETSSGDGLGVSYRIVVVRVRAEDGHLWWMGSQSLVNICENEMVVCEIERGRDAGVDKDNSRGA